MRTSTRLVGATTIMLLGGCHDRTTTEVAPDPQRVEILDIPVTLERRVDLLFVIDDSPSTADYQRNLATNFPAFIRALSAVEGGLPDVHLGVVTSDMGTQGTREASPGPTLGQPGNGGCAGTGDRGDLQVFGAPVTGAFLSDVAGPGGARTVNYTGDLATAFGQMATGAGAGGCGFEQHLAAMKSALDDNPANAGFLRPDAFLAVVFIADEDDCSFQTSALLGADTAALGPLQSFRCTRFGVTCDQGGATPAEMNQPGAKGGCHANEASAYLERVAGYVEFLKGLKPDPTKLIVAGIVGPATPVEVELRQPPGGGTAVPALALACAYTGVNGVELADPAVRLGGFLDAFGDHGLFTTVCQQDLSGAMTAIGDLIVEAIGDPCIEGTLADADLAVPGLQPDCAVSDVTGRGTPAEAETAVPACAAAPGVTPCWRIVDDAARCPATADKPHALALTVDRTTPPPDGTHVVAYCVTEPG